MKRILVDARTPVHYTMLAPVHAAMADDPRVTFCFVASEEPDNARAIFADVRDARIMSPRRAALTRFDAYITSDFMWTSLLHRTCRIQMFHGVGGKYGFDAPTEPLTAWDRLFFVNERRLRNCVAARALDAASPAIRLIGMPKVDRLVDGSLSRDGVLTSLGLRADRPTILYAPTWSPASSLNSFGVELIARLGQLDANLIVKLHDRSRDRRARYSGGVDWPTVVESALRKDSGVLAAGADICPYLVASDVMITDHSSAGFEYLLLDRPIVRFHIPELIRSANIHHDYVELLANVSESVDDVDAAVGAVGRALSNPSGRSATRRSVAADLFYKPGTATARCVSELYSALQLAPQDRLEPAPLRSQEGASFAAACSMPVKPCPR